MKSSIDNVGGGLFELIIDKSDSNYLQQLCHDCHVGLVSDYTEATATTTIKTFLFARNELEILLQTLKDNQDIDYLNISEEINELLRTTSTIQ